MATSEQDVEPARGLELEPLQRELLLEEAALFRDGLKTPEGRARYAELHACLREGDVPEHLVGAVEDLLELGLETGRLRRRYTAEGEQALLGLFHRTPRGGAVQASTAEANRALAALGGQVLRSLAFSARAPGVYGLTLTTDRGRVGVRIGRAGIWIDSVEIEA